MSVVPVSNFNLQRINTKELSDNLNATIEFGGSILAIARRGSGKTSISREVVLKSNCKEVYMNLALMERPDVGGYPDFFGTRKKDNYINFLMPSIYRDLIDGNQKCVAILDEVDKADSALLAPLLEFVQFRSVNGFKLKNLHAIIMTGNLPGEGGSRPPLPLLDRTEKFLVEVNPQHWLDWGAATGEIHPSISAYISDNLADLCGELEPDPNSFGDNSPRSWHLASKILRFGERRGWNSRLLLHKVAGCVGKHMGTKYSVFFEHYQVLLPIVEKILRGEKLTDFNNFENTKQLVACMFLCSRFSQILDRLAEEQKDSSSLLLDEETKLISDNVSKFLCTIDPEIALISIRSQIGSKRVMNFSLFEDKNWDNLLGQLVKQIEVSK